MCKIVYRGYLATTALYFKKWRNIINPYRSCDNPAVLHIYASKKRRKKIRSIQGSRKVNDSIYIILSRRQLFNLLDSWQRLNCSMGSLHRNPKSAEIDPAANYYAEVYNCILLQVQLFEYRFFPWFYNAPPSAIDQHAWRIFVCFKAGAVDWHENSVKQQHF